MSNDCTSAEMFISNPEYTYPASENQEQLIKVRCNHYGATAGNVTIKLTYIYTKSLLNINLDKYL